ncbi:MAG TPA: hypothetical protein VJY39_10580 [Acidisphaera sp.]|nr:hypothetical protein [Acidisphaera sp.]
MTEAQSAPFSVASLFAEREARQHADKQTEEELSRRHEEELAAFKHRLETFQLTQEVIEAANQRIKRAFDRGETEIMVSSFPCEFCTDNGRAINNADLPPLVKPTPEEAARLREAPAWLDTVPAGVRAVYQHFKTHMEPNGFKFGARIIDYPDGKPGHVGLFISWPKSLDQPEK